MNTDFYAERSMSRWFVPVQLSLALLVLLGAAHAHRSWRALPRHPDFQEQPRKIRPQYDYPYVVSDEQLLAVLRKMTPRFKQLPTKVNYIDHGVRLWGPTVQFGEEAYSGRQMLNMLLHHPTYAKTWGESGTPLLRRTADGVAVTTQEGQTSVSHTDHLLGTVAELGLRLNQPIVTAEGPAQLQDMVQHAFRSFELNQKEYEWTALTAAFYARDAQPWCTTSGQMVSFDTLARRLMRQPQPLGVCYGNHRIYTLVMLLRAHEQASSANAEKGLLQPATVTAVEDYLQQMTQRLFETQSTQGWWDGNWPDQEAPIPDPNTAELSRRLLATGHALEWWAMAPAKLHPPRETLVRGGQWLATTIVGMDEEQIENNYTFLTHAARALSLWRGRLPAEFISAPSP